MGKHSKTEKKVRISFRLYPSQMEKIEKIRETFGYTFQEVLEVLFCEEVTLDGLYEHSLNVVKNGKDVRTLFGDV